MLYGGWNVAILDQFHNGQTDAPMPNKTILLLFACTVFGAGKLHAQSSTDTVLVGPCSRADLHAPAFKRHFQEPELLHDGERSNALAEALDHTSLILFLGTWCEDSRDHVPMLLAELEAAHFPIGETDNPRWSMICVDESKTKPAKAVSERSVEYVPTLIVLQNGKEVGRIVETPRIGWTEDLLELVR